MGERRQRWRRLPHRNAGRRAGAVLAGCDADRRVGAGLVHCNAGRRMDAGLVHCNAVRRADTGLRCVIALILLVLVMTARPVVEAQAMSGSGDILRDRYEDTRLEIDRRNGQVNQPFAVNNLFPGDIAEQDYVVEVSHKGSVLLHFRAAVRPGYEKLAEVLKLRIEVEGQTCYDGLMARMPESVSYLVEPDTRRATVTPVDYKLTAYLDTGVGNEYQNQDLIADFQWWVLVEEQEDDDWDDGSGSGQAPGQGSGSGTGSGALPGPGNGAQAAQPSGKLVVLPRTGDIIGWIAGAALVSGLAFFLVLLWGKRRKEEEDEV